MRSEAEVILMASALEYLLEAFGQRDLYQKLEQLFGPYETAKVVQAKAARPGIQLDAGYETAQEQWPVHKKWIQEFYCLRNEYVHATTAGATSWGWQPYEHLVMSAFVFPLAVKLLLSAEGHYDLTERDIAKCRSVDTLLNQTTWEEVVGTHSDATRWAGVISETKRQSALQKAIQAAVDEIERRGNYGTGEQNSGSGS